MSIAIQVHSCSSYIANVLMYYDKHVHSELLHICSAERSFESVQTIGLHAIAK